MKKALILIMAALTLVLTGCSGDSVTSVPDLKVLINKDEITLQPEDYKWTAYDKNSKRSGSVASDVAHPLEMTNLTPYEIDDDTLKFYSDPVPNSFTVRCWPESAMGDSSVPAQEAKTASGKFDLMPGGWIYHISGVWEGGKEGKPGYYSGTAEYVIYIISNQ